MRNHVFVFLVIALMIIPIVSFALPVHAQTPEKGPAADYMVWKAVSRQNAAQALLSGDIDVYLFGLSPAAVQQLVGKPGIKLYHAVTGLVDILLNPAPVMIVQIPGKVSKQEAAQILGVNPVVVSMAIYIPKDANLTLLNSMPFIGVPLNKTDVTIAELCAKPLHAIPSNVKVLWQSSKYDINPFCFRQIRYALNYVVDRSYIAKNIYKGLAILRYTFYGPDDPIYPYLISTIAQHKFAYNPGLAKTIITKVLTEAGAQLKNGVWYYNGKPIQVIGIIRTEDERLYIGRMFASALQQLGIQVIREEVTFSEAIPKVYYTNPIDFDWFFYTEGWGKLGLQKWDPWELAQFAAPWFGLMPGWSESSYWNYINATIDFYSLLTAQTQVNAKQVKQSNYVDYLIWLQKGLIKPGEVLYVHNEQEWLNYLRKGTELGIDQSVRIWIAATMDTYATRSDVKGVTLDLAAGLANPFFYRGAYIPGKKTVKIGNLHVYTAASIWDPIGGFSDVYSVDPMYATFDPWVWNNPFNGEPMPFRVTYTVQTAGPTGKLPVPKDAVWWDAVHHRWVPAYKLNRTEATSKVVFDLSRLIGTHWHDGEAITFADIVGYYAELLDIAYNPTKSSIESSIASQLQQTLNNFVAFEFLPKQKKLVVYLNYWFFDPNYIASQAVIAPQVPIPIILAEDYLAFVKKTYALSDIRSQEENIPHINLVLKSHAEAIAKALDEINFDNYKSWFVLPNGETLMTKQEWQSRVAKIQNYIKKYGVAWISDGPFKLIEFSPSAQMLKLEAFRDPTYPFGPTTWVYGIPVPTTITSVIAPIVEPGQTARISVMVTGMPPLHVEYVLRDPATGKVIAVGQAERSPTGFLIVLPANLTAKLKPRYAYDLAVIAYSDQVALPAEKDVVLQTTAAVTKEITGVKKQIQSIQKQMTSLSTQLSSQAIQISKLGNQVKQLSTQLQQLQKQLGQQVAQALTPLTQSLTKLASTINQLAQSTSTALATINEQIKTLSTVATSMSNKVSSISSEINNLNKKIGSLQSSISNVPSKSDINSIATKASAAESRASAALWVSVINLILLLVVIALIFRKA